MKIREYLASQFNLFITNKVSQRFPTTNIIDVTDEIAILSLQGPQSHNILLNNCATPDDQQKLSQLQVWFFYKIDKLTWIRFDIIWVMSQALTIITVVWPLAKQYAN